MARFPGDGLVLAGGRSQRMGRPKEWLLGLDGQSFLARAVNTLREAVDGAVWVARPYGTSPQNPWELPDPWPDKGPLAGIYSGLLRAPGPFLAVLAVDLPNATGTLYQSLQPWLGPARAAVLPRAGATRQPLAGFWSTALAEDIRRVLEADRPPSLRAFLSAYSVAWVETDASWLVNINTPQEWQAWHNMP